MAKYTQTLNIVLKQCVVWDQTALWKRVKEECDTVICHSHLKEYTEILKNKDGATSSQLECQIPV